ncbi:MAG: OmpA family protein [Rikenellaceae bacterium]
MNKLKKIAMLFAVALLAHTSVSAQTEDEVFNPHWNLRVHAGAAHTVGETKFSELLSPAAGLSAGYEFTSVFGLRLGLSGWQGKGKVVGVEDTFKYNYVQANLEATFDIVNIFADFKSDRLFNPYIMVGAGVNNAFNNDEAVALSTAGYVLENVWDGNKATFVGRAGIGVDIRISDRVAFNIETNGNMMSDKFNSKKASKFDWQYNALAGLTITFGKSSKTIAKAAPAPVAKPAPAPAPKPEPKAEPKPEPKPAPAPKAEPKNVNIYFELDSDKITTAEAYKIDEIVKYLNADPKSTVELTGYADKQTGNAKYNQKISEKRSAKVSEALVAKGIPTHRIITDSKGDTVQPFGENDKNRVVICIVE